MDEALDRAAKPPAANVRDWFWFLMVAGIITGYLFTRPLGTLLSFDSLSYMGGADGFIELGSYRYPQWVGTPRIGVYPPGNSLLLAVPRIILGPQCDHPVGFGRWQAGIGMLALAGVFHLLRRLDLPLVLSLGTIATLGSSQEWTLSLLNCYSDQAFTGLISLAGCRSVHICRPRALAELCV